MPLGRWVEKLEPKSAQAVAKDLTELLNGEHGSDYLEWLLLFSKSLRATSVL